LQKVRMGSDTVYFGKRKILDLIDYGMQKPENYPRIEQHHLAWCGVYVGQLVSDPRR